MHNFIAYPSRLNSVRGNDKMTDRLCFSKGSSSVCNVTGETLPIRKWEDMESRSFKSKGFFVPNVHIRGQIARCVAYCMSVNPESAWILHERVLDVHLLVDWHHRYRASELEIATDDMIYDVQGTRNDLIRNPESIWEATKPFADAGILDANFFSAFEY